MFVASQSMKTQTSTIRALLSIKTAFVLMGLLAPLVSADETISVQQLIDDLSSRKFIQRETATLELIDRGTSVIPLLEKNISQQNYEGLTRSIHVLVQLSLQVKTARFGPSNGAKQTLDLLAQSTDNRIARRAATALTRINKIREEEALTEFRKLGGWIERVYTRIGPNSKYVIRMYLNTSWRGTEEDLYLLTWITTAQELLIEGVDLSGNWMPIIGKMRNLESLVLKRCTLHDKLFAEVRHLKKLSNLDLRYCPITDTGLQPLTSMTQLLYVKLYGTLGTKDVAESIRQDAQADVDYRQGAFLGVGCRQPPGPCYIESIQDGTAADKGGLVVGDIVTGFDDRKVESFLDLRKIISDYAAGDKSVVHILRLGSPHKSTISKVNQDELQVTLAEHTGGVLVTDIKATCPLYLAGLRKGHIVNTINLAEVHTPKELLSQYKLAQKGPVQMTYYTMSKKMKISVEFGEWE